MQVGEISYFTKELDAEIELWTCLGFVKHEPEEAPAELNNPADPANKIIIRTVLLKHDSFNLILMSGQDYTQDDRLTVRPYGAARQLTLTVSDSTELRELRQKVESSPTNFCVMDLKSWTKTVNGQPKTFKGFVVHHLKDGGVDDDCKAKSNNKHPLGLIVRVAAPD